jgi:hypothetical protein
MYAFYQGEEHSAARTGLGGHAKEQVFLSLLVFFEGTLEDSVCV